MSYLSVYHHSHPQQPVKTLTHLEDIVATLAAVGVRFERQSLNVSLRPGAVGEDVLASCNDWLASLAMKYDYRVAEVLSVDASGPEEASIPNGPSYRQAGEECWLFLGGRALLSLHIDGHVHAIYCERNDRVTVPADIPRWIDLGDVPRVLALRLLAGTDDRRSPGEADDLAGRFPRLDD